MAKKQTRRSISVSRTTYERLKAFCEANNISMSQLVETRVNDFLGEGVAPTASTPAIHSDRPPMAPRPLATTPAPIRPVVSERTGSTVPAATPTAPKQESAPVTAASPAARAPAPSVPMTSAAARFAVDPPPPIIKPKQETAAPKPAEKRPDQIFTF